MPDGPESMLTGISLPTWSRFASSRFVREGALQVLVDEEMGPDVVCHVVAGIAHRPVAGDVLEDLPVLHLVAFAVAVVLDRIVEPDVVVGGKEAGPFAVQARLDGLGLDAVVGRDDAAVGDVEPDAMHAQLVVDEDVVRVPRVE